MSKFAVGDKVKCVTKEHQSWTDSVMEVVRFYPSGIIECRHESKGVGGFFASQLEKVEASLEEQKQQLQKQLDEINIKIADEKEKARLELGNKEVEIKLTLNELAWIVSSLGRHTYKEINVGLENQEKINSVINGIFKNADNDSQWDTYTRLQTELVKSVK